MPTRYEEYTSELQSLMRTSYAIYCLKKKQYLSFYIVIRRPTRCKLTNTLFPSTTLLRTASVRASAPCIVSETGVRTDRLVDFCKGGKFAGATHALVAEKTGIFTRKNRIRADKRGVK